MSFILHDQEVTCCGNCPNNISSPNEFLTHPIFKYLPVPHDILPPTHRCSASLDTSFFNSGGKLILNPNKIPDWCPFGSQ